MATAEKIVAALKARFPALGFELQPLVVRGQAHAFHPNDPKGADIQYWVRIEPEHLLEVTGFLRSDPRLLFEQLCDLTCVDYLNFPNATDRYGIIYSLLSLTHNHRFWLKAFANDPAPRLPSVTATWKGADWMEREVFDMFGVVFEGHPDLRRILTWDGFVANPLRKDYPLRGRGEREDYKVITRDSA
jgi:NADH-quinone oxidoreductase subunit C